MFQMKELNVKVVENLQVVEKVKKLKLN